MPDKKLKILVVDDEINVCKSIRQAILSEEYDVDMALSGEDALKQDKEKRYDLVITDLMMPGISGMDLLKSLREDRAGIPVVMVTGYPTIKTAVESVKVGAFDYIAKPFTPSELRSVVARAIKQSETPTKEEAPVPQMPSDLYYMKGHTWLRRDKPGVVTVGVVYDFIKSLSKITGIETIQANKNVFQGEVFARITDSEENVHRVWSPASGRVITVNEALKQDSGWLRRDPYQKGWLIRIESPDLEKDLESLTPAS